LGTRKKVGRGEVGSNKGLASVKRGAESPLAAGFYKGKKSRGRQGEPTRRDKGNETTNLQYCDM